VNDLLKPKKQLIEELQDLRAQVNRLMAREIHLEEVGTDLQLTLHDLQVHQEELRAQNEELRKAREEAERSRTKYLRLFDFAPIGYFTLDANTKIQEVNLTGVEMLGHQRSHLMGKPLFLYVVPEYRAALAAHFRRVFAGWEAAIESTFMRQDGKRIPVVLQSSRVQDAITSEYLCLTAALDITERIQAEESLRESKDHLEKTLTELKETQGKMMQQERLAAVGQLTAGIAHDFNNILTSILGFADLIQMSPHTPAVIRPSLNKISASSQRAAYLVRQLLDFSRKTIRQPKQFDLTPFTKEAVKFLERTIPENIHLVLEINPGDYTIEADPTQIQQLVTNLVLNGKDAMPEGGELRIVLSSVTGVQETTCVLCDETIEGTWIRVKVADTGSGIASEIMSRIFEPFFTTKEAGEGSGLGLSQVSGIVVQHGGHLEVESRVGRGTHFAVYLPLPILTQDNAEPESTRPVWGRGETILLVEDEPSVLEVGREMLGYLGYQVMTAENGIEAIRNYEENTEKIALVLSDMIMPDMNGEALFAVLKEKNPDIKMVLMSGYPLEEEGARLLKQGLVSWFQKPMSTGQLSQVVGKALSNQNGR
jgi:PAS domain S-box-containing protein